MSTYSAIIIKVPILRSIKQPKRAFKVVAPPIIGVTRPNDKYRGVELRTFNVPVFSRIPRERILNKFRSQGGNIKY